MAHSSTPHFHNTEGLKKIEVGSKEFMCVGALPPFGSQYGMMTMVDPALAQAGRIVIESNTLETAIRMAYGDFAALERPQVARISHRVDRTE